MYAASDPPLHGVTDIEEKLFVLTEDPAELQLGQVPGQLELLLEDPAVPQVKFVLQKVHVNIGWTERVL